MSLTWKQFKELVDKEVKPDEEIWYIDISYPQEERMLIIEHGELGVTIK